MDTASFQAFPTRANPEAARTLLMEKLLPLHSTLEYEDALREAEAALGIERPRG